MPPNACRPGRVQERAPAARRTPLFAARAAPATPQTTDLPLPSSSAPTNRQPKRIAFDRSQQGPFVQHAKTFTRSEEWKIWKRINARPAKALAAYPDLERQDFDETLDQTAAAAALRPMPVVVLTASDKFIDVVPKLIQAGELPPDTPPDFGAVVDRANSAAQKELAALVPGAVHITDTHSGHNIMIDNAPVVIQAIRMVVDAVRAGQTSLKG